MKEGERRQWRNVGIKSPPDPHRESEWFKAEMGKMFRGKKQIVMTFPVIKELEKERVKAS